MKARAFSLVELLVVIAIVMLLATLAVPAFHSIAVGSSINRAGQTIGDQIALARLTAVTKNREVQVRIFNLTNGVTAGWQGIQVWRVEQTATGTTNIPTSKLTLLPEGIIIDPATSPLLTADANVNGTVSVPSRGNLSYCGFRFRASGATDNSVNFTNSYLTVRQAAGATNNFYTVQINPVTGKTAVYRP